MTKPDHFLINGCNAGSPIHGKGGPECGPPFAILIINLKRLKLVELA